MSILIDNDISLAFISETWFSSQTNSVTAHIKNYGFDLIHVFREKRGGGVGILWKKSIQKFIRFSSVKNNFDTFQYQIIIFNGTVKTIFVCIYRFQETLKSVFFEELNALLVQLDPCNPIILVGDFNFHFEISNLSEVRELTSITSSHGLSQFVFGPTHKRGHTLDLLFANKNYFFTLTQLIQLTLKLVTIFLYFLMCLYVQLSSDKRQSILFSEIIKMLICQIFRIL